MGNCFTYQEAWSFQPWNARHYLPSGKKAAAILASHADTPTPNRRNWTSSWPRNLSQKAWEDIPLLSKGGSHDPHQAHSWQGHECSLYSGFIPGVGQSHPPLCYAREQWWFEENPSTGKVGSRKLPVFAIDMVQALFIVHWSRVDTRKKF